MKGKVLSVLVIILVLAGEIHCFRLFNRPVNADARMKAKYIKPTNEAAIPSRLASTNGVSRQHSSPMVITPSASVDTSREEALLKTSLEYIDRYRATNVSIGVVDPDGQPLVNVSVNYRQLSHDFIFSASLWVESRYG